MVILAVIMLILLFAMGGILFTPVQLYVDTDQCRYEIFQRPVVQFSFIPVTRGPHLRFKLFGFNVPLDGKAQNKKPKEQVVKNQKRFHRSLSAWRTLVNKIRRSIRINRAVLDVDTDNVVLNAQLVPFFFALSRGPVQLSSNFDGRVYFHLEVSSRPARILWFVLRFLIKK